MADVPVRFAVGELTRLSQALGVARISFGPSLYDACGAHLASLIADPTTGASP